MATEKEKIDVSPKQAEDANPNEVEEKDVNEEEEQAEGKGDEEEEGMEGKGDEEEERAEGKSEDEDEEEEKTDREESEKKSPRTPGSERPTRERKKVERLLVGQISTPASSKTLTIEKGQGTQLKDIPNVAFKLSKRKADENLQHLHNILFGKKAKVHNLKKNIGLFSGFVWVENKEKQRVKVQDKIDKCVKEKLLDFCDVLNIPVNKSTAKKELSAKLLDFLESPHATTDSLLADKEKGKKRKTKSTTGKSPSSLAAGKSKKKQKLVAESEKKPKHSIEEDKSESSESEDDHGDTTVREAESDHEEELNSEEGTDGDETEKPIAVEESSSKRSGKNDSGKAKLKSKSGKESQVKSSKSGTSTEKASSSISKKEAEPVSKRKARTQVNKKKKDDEASEDKVGLKNGTSSSKKKSRKSSKKEQGEQSTKVAKKQPTREEMHSAVADILKEVDFETATLSDILRQLEKHFGVNLIDRKKEVKEIITEVIEGMSDNEGEKTESEEESGKGDDE